MNSWRSTASVKRTADDILLYALRKPVFVIDAYTKRVFQRLCITPEGQTYRAWQAFFHHNLPPDAPFFNEYHALIDHHAATVCRPRPLCGDCCLLDVCPVGRQATVGGRCASQGRSLQARGGRSFPSLSPQHGERLGWGRATTSMGATGRALSESFALRGPHP